MKLYSSDSPFAICQPRDLLHMVPARWEQAVTIRVAACSQRAGKVLLFTALVYLVIQLKSAETQPFIYFQF